MEIEEGTVIMGDQVGTRERKDLNRSRSYLADIVSRNGRPESKVVYSSIVEASLRAAQLAQEVRQRR